MTKKERNNKIESSRKKGTEVNEVDAENHICEASFFDDEDNIVECKQVQYTKCKGVSHVYCISQLHQNLFSSDTVKNEECLYQQLSIQRILLPKISCA